MNKITSPNDKPASRGEQTAQTVLKKGDFVRIFNTTMGGVIFEEGKARIMELTDTQDRFLVMFPNGDQVERFAQYENKL